MVMMGDQQVSSSSVDLPRGVSPFYPTDQAVVGKAGRGGSSPPPSMLPDPRSSSSAAQAPLKPGGGGGGDQSSSSSLGSTTTTEDDEVNVNSVITSLGLMQVDPSSRHHHLHHHLQQQQQQVVNSSNFQNLSPSIYQLLAQSQSQHPLHRWPMTGTHKQHQHQQNAVSNFCPTTFQGDSQFANLPAGLGWNGDIRANLSSHNCSDLNTPWGQNQEFRKANSLLSNIADTTLMSKLQQKSSFAKNFQQSASVRNGKSVSEESNDYVNQLNHDAEMLKLNSIDASILEMSGLSQSQDHLKGFPNWAFNGQLTTKRDQVVPNLSQLSGVSPNSLSPLMMEHYSRKVFVGGLPPDIDEEEITAAFRRFGPLIVDWPHKAESKSYFPPKGYCFLLFQDELSVQTLIDTCINEDGKLYWLVSSPTMKDKMVQIRPWNLADSDFVMNGSQPLDPRKTIFVGGVPRPLRAFELAVIMERLYGGVCYVGIDTDPELKYPKGAGRVAFSSQQSYIAAISARFVQLQHGEIDKRVEVKPYVLDDQLCDECQGIHCGGRFAPFFCANVTCLQYYCERCWSHIHSRPGREFHKPLVKEGADRPRSLPFRWC